MNTYRIYTEDKNRDKVLNMTSVYFKGFTFFPCIGYWMGDREDSLVIEIIGEAHIYRHVQSLAHWIKVQNKQQNVLITTTPSEREMV